MDRKSTDSTAVESSGSAGTRLRVVVAEDDTLLREGLASLLERSTSTLWARLAMLSNYTAGA